MTNCYLTGSRGFIGSYLRRYLEERGDTIVGTADYTDSPYKIPPQTEIVYHLGALVRPQESNLQSYRHPYFTKNVEAVVRICAVVTDIAPRAKVVLFGSGGQDHLDSWYGYTKAMGELVGDAYAKLDGLQVYRLRLFGVTGVGKTGDVINDFAEQVVRDGQIKHGKLDYLRDISDVRDMVPSIVEVVEKEKPGTYWMGRGQGTFVRNIAEWFKVPLIHDSTRDREEDYAHISPEKRLLSSRPIEDTLEWVLNGHREAAK